MLPLLSTLLDKKCKQQQNSQSLSHIHSATIKDINSEHVCVLPMSTLYSMLGLFLAGRCHFLYIFISNVDGL